MKDSMQLTNANSLGVPLGNHHGPSMKKRVSAGLAVLMAATLLAGLGWQLLRPQEPSYQGKQLSAWLYEVWYLDGGVDPEAEKAVRQIGTNAIPYLLKLATIRDSALKTKVSAVLPEKWLVSYVTKSAHNHFSAAFGFEALGPAAKTAVPALINLLDYKDEDIRKTAAHSLGSIGSAAQDAIPKLIEHLNDPSKDVQVCSVDALANIPRKSVQEVPDLLRVLNSPPKELYIAIGVIERLGEFQSQAKVAVPAILPYLHSQDIATRDCAAKALKQIDP